MTVKTIVVFLLGLVFVSGCVASGASPYRPCHELRTDMSISNDEFERRCPRGAPD
jgi:outer membrane lipoprotein-sorting protein